MPRDFTTDCRVDLRLPTRGNLLTWDFEKDGKSLSVLVNGQAVFNNTFLML